MSPHGTDWSKPFEDEDCSQVNVMEGSRPNRVEVTPEELNGLNTFIVFNAKMPDQKPSSKGRSNWKKRARA